MERGADAKSAWDVLNKALFYANSCGMQQTDIFKVDPVIPSDLHSVGTEMTEHIGKQMHSAYHSAYPLAEGRRECIVDEIVSAFESAALAVRHQRDLEEMRWRSKLAKGKRITDSELGVSLVGSVEGPPGEEIQLRWARPVGEADGTMPPTTVSLWRHKFWELRDAYHKACCERAPAVGAVEARSLMLTRIFVMTLRYDSISEAKSAYQAACPTRLMERLAMEPLCVRHECYASPLNRFHANFCSMYPDVDRFFGSKGNFYDYDQFTDGCYEANPPFDGMSVGSCFYRLRAVLAAASTPLTFVMVLPDMDLTSSRPDRQTYLQQGFSSASAFLSAKRAVEATAHVYRMGLQHKLTSQVNGMTEHHWRPEQRSWIYFFQNEAGRARWPITEELQDELAREFDY